MSVLTDPILSDVGAAAAAAWSAHQAGTWDTPGELAVALDPKTVQTPALRLIDTALVEAATASAGRLIITCPPQEGKALALDTPVPTPDGWATIGALRVGDQVFGRDGRPCTVTWVSPIWRDRPCYRVTTGDGESIVADAAHEWAARLTTEGPERIHNTTVLASPRVKNAIVTAGAVLDLPDAELPVDPYVLGAWLGDGHTNAAMLTSADAGIVQRIRAAGVPCRKLASSEYGYSLTPEGGGSRCSPIRRALVDLGVFGNKHIPTMYLRASARQRLNLLQGLIDTDGYVMPKGQVEFTSTNRCLAEGVRELVYSLGAKAVMTAGRATLNGRDISAKYRVRFYLAEAASLARKARHCKDSSVARRRYITATPTASVPTVCIEVDSPDHMYLAGRTMIPTHNSQRASRRFPLWALSRDPELRIAMASYEANIARRWGRAVRDDITVHGHRVGLAVRPDVSAQNEWQLTGHDGGMISVGIGSALTGRPADLLLIDDPVKDREHADSKTYRDRAWDWWIEVAAARLSPDASVIVILTRWHEDDLAGRLLRADDGHLWNVINIPAQADHNPDAGQVDILGRSPGDFLESARGRTRAQWEAIKLRSGARSWNALYQGRPAPDTGNVWQRAWWRRYDTPLWSSGPAGVHLVDGADEVVSSWDMTFKDTKGSDFVVGQVWARKGASVYLLDQVHARMSFTDTVAAFTRQVEKWPQVTAKYVEDKANGTAVIDTLRGKIPGIVPVTPHESKYSRANAVAPFIEAGNVYLPDPGIALFDVAGFIDEAAAFPNAAHDDQVDAASQALARLLLDGVGAGAWIEYLRGKATPPTEPEPGETPEPTDTEPALTAREAARRTADYVRS